MKEESLPIRIPLAQLKDLAASVAGELTAAAAITPTLREQFITVRSALFQRGIYDPVLVRFDSATAPRATAEEVGTQLAAIAEGL